MRRGVLACLIVILFLLQTFSNANLVLTESSTSNSYREDVLFNQSGFYEDGVYTTPDGEVHVNRPHIQWTIPNQGLAMIRTGACSVAIDSLEEVWLMGGRTDPNPTQSNDETPTSFIEKMDNVNKSWAPSGVAMPSAQQYCEAELVGNLVVVVGDWYRNSNPSQLPTGRVQIYNLDNGTWYTGTSMPSSQERGLGAMAEANGYLYYAGGVRSPNANDATNRTYRYDPVSDQWTRMADMNHARASFELVNFHGQLYAMGGFHGTQTWNRQALDYVERYDPATDTWTNLSKLPVAMFGWGGTVLNDEIVLVGGYNGGTKKTVYHWNPVEDTWSQGNNIGSIGHFDVTVEEINGSIVWATGDMSSYPYSSWSQLFSADTEFQNTTSAHHGWVTSPVIDLRPNVNGRATPVQFDLTGTDTPGGELGFQYRAAADANSLSSEVWAGIDGTINTTFPIGTTDMDLGDYADFIQYRIRFQITDMKNWDEPDLDSMSVRAEHAAFTSSIPAVLNPRAETLHIQTSHDIFSSGDMYVEFASCDQFGAVNGPWSTLSHDGTSFQESDIQGLFIQSNGAVNSTSLGETLIDWSIDLGDLTGINYLCTKVGSAGTETTEFIYTNPIEIDNALEVRITDLGMLGSGDAVTGNVPINVGIEHSFPSSGMTLSSGDLQARLKFDIRVNDAATNNYTQWVNQTTPWTDLTAGQPGTISWTLPSDVSGIVNITLESRSDQSFQMMSDSNSSMLILDNLNPLIISSIPEDEDYLNSEENRELSILIADTSGFVYEDMTMQVWVQAIDDASDGSFPDGMPQESEYRDINFSLENNGSLWWFNGTQSDDQNEDQQLVYMRIIGDDLTGFSTTNNTVWWKTRDAQNAVVERIFNEDSTQFWEVSRHISWDIEISDGNGISDIMSLRIELGDDSDFGLTYDVADSICSVMDTRIDSDRTTCSHTYVDDNMLVSVSIFAGWEVDRSVLDEGLVEIFISDIDGTSKTTFQNMWVFSEDFDFSISQIEDVSGPVTGPITNASIMIVSEEMRITGSMTHSLSGLPYQGDLSVSWWGLLQGQDWFGSATVEVVDGVINATIPMPSTGGIIDFDVAFMDPWGTRTLGVYDAPVFIIDDEAPVILDSSIEDLSRYHLDDVGIGVNIVEDETWSGELGLTCQVISTEVQWEPVTILLQPSNVFQGKTLFSFSFDLSDQGDPSQLSPEAQIDCWASGMDDAGWDLQRFSGESLNDPWLTVPLSTIGPNIELVDVKLDGMIEPGKELRAEISVMNSGESLQESFNITVYTIIDGESTLVGLYSQAQIASGQGIIKRVAVTVPEGDWELLVIVDEDQRIWELNEEDNIFSKKYSAPEEMNLMLYLGAGGGILVVLALFIVLRKRSDGELTQSKKLPSLEDLPRSGPPQASRNKSGPPPSSKPKSGPPPKPKPVEEIPPTTNVADAMAKLSLSNLPGRTDAQPQSVPNYESLPGGGEYEYLTEGTFYFGEGIGRWRLEDDGSFTKME